MLSEMQRSSAAGEHGRTAAEEMLSRRERELVAQLYELLFPSPSTPAPAPSEGAAWSSGLNVPDLFDECSPSPVKALCQVPVPCRRRRGRKRVREDEQHEEQHASAKPRCGNKTRRKKQGTTTLVTTVPDFDGYQWRKYGQKQIEGAKYPRSYYRCTNSTDQCCPAKRTVQRNDDDHAGEGGPKKYTVVYISEHTCKATESVAPVILETTVRTNNPAADHNNTAAARVIPSAAPDAAAVVPAESAGTASTGTESPAISEITWSGGDMNLTPSERGDYSHVFAADDWEPTAAAAAALLQEMDFTGPIRSPVHVVADGWIDDLLVSIPSPRSYDLFGF